MHGVSRTNPSRSFESCFDEIDTEIKAYWLGFIAADGCVLWNEATGNYALSVGLQGGDVEHLMGLERDLGGSRVPARGPRNGSVKLVWYSKYLAQRLMALGIPPRKSGQDLAPLYPRPLASHFWRGVFDGDGCLVRQVKNPSGAPEYRFSLAGSLSMLAAFQEWARGEANARLQHITKARNSEGDSRTYVFYMSGNRQIEAVMRALYLGCSRMLRRKYDVYLTLIEQNHHTRPSYLRAYTSNNGPAES